jgi:hypothetical protein
MYLFIYLFIIIIIIYATLVWPLINLVYSIHNNPSIVAYLIFISYFNLMRCLLRNVTLNVLKY